MEKHIHFPIPCLCLSVPDPRSVSVYSGVNSMCVFLFTSVCAGLFLILGQLLYAAGWGSEKVKQYCGVNSSAYNPALCSVGWAFYTALLGTVLSFISAVFSAQAEIATSSDKVQEEIQQGKNLICLL